MNGGRTMVPMRMRTGRALAACLIGAGCAAWGLAGGLPGTALAAAIFGYNHATWYVSEVLALAGEYAQEYP